MKSGMLIAMSVYTYLRLIVDHGAPNLLPLRQKEVDFCISMLREKVGKKKRKGDLVSVQNLVVTLETLSLCFCVVHGVPNHWQRSGSSATECRPDPRDGAAVEGLVAQPTSPQSSVYRWAQQFVLTIVTASCVIGGHILTVHGDVFAAGILQLLTARTSRKFLACRLTPDMETKLLFMTSRVKS